jgi:REP element-mobilizing transposase RayT
MHDRKNIRLQNYNYTSNGYYFVTAVSQLRQDIFLGREKEIEDQLLDLKNKVPGINLDYYVIMPNHVHIIFILNNCKLHLGEIVRRFKAKISKAFGQHVWQANYYEHVVRNEKALMKVFWFNFFFPIKFPFSIERNDPIFLKVPIRKI